MKYSLHWKINPYSKTQEPTLFDADNSDMTKYGYVFDREIDIEPSEAVNHASLVGAAVQELRAEQAKHTAAITELDRQIADLLCIEFKPGE